MNRNFLCKPESLEETKNIDVIDSKKVAAAGGAPRYSQLTLDVGEVLCAISRLFDNKNAQYRTNDDDLANFTTGALLRYGKADMPARFEALKDYVEKHISKVYNGRLLDDKMDESIMDIAVYFIIAAVMHKRATNK